MSSDKLNKVAKAYTAAMSNKSKPKDDNVEAMRKKLADAEAKEGASEDADESEEVQEAEEMAGVEKHKKSKKLDLDRKSTV